MDRYEEEYRAYWKICLKSVPAPVDEMQLGYDNEHIKREAEKEQWSAENDPFWLFKKMASRRSFSVVADRRDILRLRGEQEYIRMHPARWLWTMDAILAEYMYLIAHNTENQVVQLPDLIREARHKYIKQRKQGRKSLRIPIEQFKFLGKSNSANICCLMPRYTGIARLNLLCHDLCTDPRATEEKSGIHYNGLKFGLDHKKTNDTKQADRITNLSHSLGDFLPAYTLSDYIFHELMTGLSLSIEITAALMELEPEIRELALDAFFDKALEIVAKSKYIYTRIAAARSFFYQIHLEWLKRSYSWSSEKETITEDETKQWASPGVWASFKDSIDFASTHLKILNLDCVSESFEGVNYQTYPDDRIRIESAQDVDMLDRLDQLRNTRGESVAPWLFVDYQEETEIYIRRRQFSFRKVSVPNSNSELNELIQYYEGLLGMVDYPLGMSKWKDAAPSNLAVFVQRKHKYVPILLDYLDNEKMRKGSAKAFYTSMGEYPEIFADNCDTCVELYKKVHRKVQEACLAAARV